MDHRFNIPLFLETDQELALQYLIKYMIASNSVSSFPEGRYSDIDLSGLGATTEVILSNLINSKYGDNKHIIANYAKCEEMFFSLFKDQILEYLSLAGVRSSFLIINTKEAKRMKMEVAFEENPEEKLLILNPSEKWTNCFNFVNGEDAWKTNICLPIADMYKVNLVINGLIHAEFIKYLDRRSGSNLYKEFKERGKVNISIPILPTSDPTEMFILMSDIHRYF